MINCGVLGMSRPRRNDPCPCGSGKKFKKCCGANNVIEFNPALYNNELDLLNEELMGFAVTNFESELTMHSQYYVESYLDESNEEKINTYVALLSAWIILKKPMENGKTIFDMFYAKQKNKIKLPRTKKVFWSWGNAQPGIFEITSIDDQAEPTMTLRDINTYKTYQCLRDNETEHDIGNFAIGMLIPYVNTHDFLFGMIEIPKEHEDHILNLLDNIESNNEELDDVFPEFLAESIHPHEEYTFEWFDPRHEMVARLFVKHMMEKELDEVFIQAGVLLWNTYCHRQNPIIRKLGSYAAALEYLIHLTFVEDTTITQAQIAREYDTSPGTVSTNYRRLADEVAKEIEAYDLTDGEIHHSETSSTPSFPAGPDHIGTFSMEQEMRDIQKLLAEKEFETPEEVNDYLNNLLQDGNVPPAANEPHDIAQDMIQDAFNKQGKEQKHLIKKALDIYPNSPDAYLLLAEDAGTPKERRKLLQQAITAGEEDLGKKFIKDNKGYFWGLVETRPFMRAKAAYAISLEQAGFYEEAIKHYKEMLELNPNDNQGIRDLLLPLYIEVGDLKQAKKLIQTYEDDIMATFTFNKALVCYLTDGMTEQAIRLLKEAGEKNPYVMDYLLGSKKVPNETFDYIGIGDETEAISYVQGNIHLWADAGELLKELKR